MTIDAPPPVHDGSTTTHPENTARTRHDASGATRDRRIGLSDGGVEPLVAAPPIANPMPSCAVAGSRSEVPTVSLLEHHRWNCDRASFPESCHFYKTRCVGFTRSRESRIGNRRTRAGRSTQRTLPGGSSCRLRIPISHGPCGTPTSRARASASSASISVISVRS